METLNKKLNDVVTASLVVNQGNGIYDIECHESGKSWRYVVKVLESTKLVRKTKGSPSFMGNFIVVNKLRSKNEKETNRLQVIA